MDRLTAQQRSDLLQIRANPAISLYLPVEKVGAETRQGTIRLRKMIKTIGDALRQAGMRPPQIEHLLLPLEQLCENALFWEYQNHGLALFVYPEGLIIHQLSERCEESVTLADRFMILPLLSEADNDQPFLLLGLSLAGTRLYQGSRYALSEIDLPEPRSLKTVIASYDLEKQLQHHSSGSGAGGSVFHASESARDREKGRIEEFFRQIDTAVRKVGTPDVPLVVACVDYLFPLFRSVCRDSRLLLTHVSGSPENMKMDTLTDQAWQIARNGWAQQKQVILDHCRDLSGTARTSADLSAILPAAATGRVDRLCIKRGSQVWGDWQPERGEAPKFYEASSVFGEPDLLSLAACLTLDHGGQVHVLDPTEMPLPVAAFALLRY